MSWSEHEFSGADLGDARLKKRLKNKGRRRELIQRGISTL
jgi:hypothetical protein